MSEHRVVYALLVSASRHFSLSYRVSVYIYARRYGSRRNVHGPNQDSRLYGRRYPDYVSHVRTGTEFRRTSSVVRFSAACRPGRSAAAAAASAVEVVCLSRITDSRETPAESSKHEDKSMLCCSPSSGVEQFLLSAGEHQFGSGTELSV